MDQYCQLVRSKFINQLKPKSHEASAIRIYNETRGSFIEITKQKLLEFHIPDVDKIDTSYLLEAFQQIRNDELPPLV